MRLFFCYSAVRFFLGLAVLLMLAGGSKAQLKVEFEFRTPTGEPSGHVGHGIAIVDPCADPEVPCPNPCHPNPEGGCFPVVVDDTDPSMFTIMTTASDRPHYAIPFGLRIANAPVLFNAMTIGPPVSIGGSEAIFSFTSETSPTVMVMMAFDVSGGEFAMSSSGSPVSASEPPMPDFPGEVQFQFTVMPTGVATPSVTVTLGIMVDGMVQEIHSGDHGP